MADRLLPDSPDETARGLTSDVVAVLWLGFPLIFAVGLGSFTSAMMVREGDRLQAAGWELSARGAYLLAAVEPQAEAPTDGSRDAPPALTAPSASPSSDATAATTAAATALPSAEPESPPRAPKSAGELEASELFEKWAPAVARVRERYDLPEGRVTTGKAKPSPGSAATVEVDEIP